MRKLATRLIQIGTFTTSLAIVWWHAFYRVIAQQVMPALGESDPTVGTGLTCLYSNSGICAEVISYAESVDKIVYTPIVFWLGIVVLAVGIVLRVMDKHRTTML